MLVFNYIALQNSYAILFILTILHYKLIYIPCKGGNYLSSSQILKGILEGCLLSIIAKGETYGYEMTEKLSAYGFTMVSEGSIYPLLLRMKKEGLVITNQRKVPSGGPKRKYYSITVKGEEELEEFKRKWSAISDSVNHLLGKEG